MNKVFFPDNEKLEDSYERLKGWIKVGSRDLVLKMVDEATEVEIKGHFRQDIMRMLDEAAAFLAGGKHKARIVEEVTTVVVPSLGSGPVRSRSSSGHAGPRVIVLSDFRRD